MSVGFKESFTGWGTDFRAGRVKFKFLTLFGNILRTFIGFSIVVLKTQSYVRVQSQG